MAGLPKLSSRQWIAILKGSFAYTLVFVLIFLRDFNKLNQFPITLTSAVLVSIAGQPGLSVGACLDNGALAMIGVGIGAGMFAILAKLGHSQVAQGFVFAVFVYVMAYIKAQSIRYFGFSLLAIIMAFSGIYTSILLGDRFSPEYLESYLISYCWGFAIVLGTNLLIFPTSSERELRVLIVSSLERISTFSHLLAKTYALEITDEERVVRDELNGSIRADFGYMAQKTGQVAYEINYTRWSLADYGAISARIRQMQQGLITSYSSLNVMEQYVPEALELIKNGLADPALAKAFQKLRRGVDLAIADIVSELAVGGQTHHSPAPGEYSWEDFLEYSDKPTGDLEDGDGRPLQKAPSQSPHNVNVDEGFERVTMRLKSEIAGYSGSPAGSRRPSFSEGESSKDRADFLPTGGSQSQGGLGSGANTPGGSRPDLKNLDRVASIRQSWSIFKDKQNASITELLASGVLDDDELRVLQPAPSLHQAYYTPESTVREYMSTSLQAQQVAELKRRKNAATKSETEQEKVESSSEASGSSQKDSGATTGPNGSREQIAGTAILRVFSFIFGMGQVLDELADLHKFAVPKTDSERRPKKLHFHIFERKGIRPPVFKGMAFQEALSSVTGRTYTKPKTSLWQIVGQAEKFLRSPTSLYAFKTACAVSVYTVFLLAPSLKKFFVDYGLTGGLITIVVAMAPVLGQSVFVFALQICGTGLGALYGLLILRIFHHVGGYYFNPYGLAAMLALFSLPASFLIYTKPMFFAGPLLALNGAGIAVVTQYVYREIPGQIRPEFDSPAYRAGKQLTALALALGVALFFQVLILRSPARQKLRIALSHVTFSLSSYSVLFSLMTESLVPMHTLKRDDREPPSQEAIESIANELKRREGQIQTEILELMPLVKFSALEPAFGSKFDSGTLVRIIRNHQVILDRLREARTAFGTTGFPKEILENFTEPLTPFREQSKRFTRALFYLIGSSIATKLPLPHGLPSMLTAARNIQHDALVLSHRLAATPEGVKILRSNDFIRYWYYLVSMSSVSYRLEAMESDIWTMLGTIESSPFVLNPRPEGGFM